MAKKQSLPVRVAGSLIDFLAFTAMCGGLVHLGAAKPIFGVGALALGMFVLVCYSATTIITESGIAWPLSQAVGKIPLLGPALYEATYVVTDASGEKEVPADFPNAVLKDEVGLLKCPLCTGMWVGALLAAVGLAVTPVAPGLWHGVRDLVLHGLLGAGTAYGLTHVIKR